MIKLKYVNSIFISERFSNDEKSFDFKKIYVINGQIY